MNNIMIENRYYKLSQFKEKGHEGWESIYFSVRGSKLALIKRDGPGMVKPKLEKMSKEEGEHIVKRTGIIRDTSYG